MERTNFRRDMVIKNGSGSNYMILEEERFANNGFSSIWLQRHYTCSFCKRQFNSAQALGGHMNVHRRDRAVLRQLPSLIFPYPNTQNSNNYSHSNLVHPFSSASKKPFSTLPPPKHFAPYSNNHISFISPLLSSLSSPPTCHLKRCTQSDDQESNKDLFTHKYAKEEVSKEGFNEVISLDLEMGCKDPAEVLDLELRLGCL